MHAPVVTAQTASSEVFKNTIKSSTKSFSLVASVLLGLVLHVI